MNAKAGFENCVYCHGGGQDVPLVNTSLLSSGIHARLNNATPTTINFACYACHWDGTAPNVHPVNRTTIKTCEDCHRTNNTLFDAPTVSEHRPDGDHIKTDAGCLTCHGNSIKTNALYASTAEGVSHYGTTTELMTPAIRSNNCMWCHFDQEGNPLWGSPRNPRKSVIGINHSFFTVNQDCYSCHVAGGTIPKNFHIGTLNKGGGKDCISCHDIGGVVPMNRQVDFSAMNKKNYIHYGLNSNAKTVLNNNDTRCWACHGDGNGSEAAQPIGHPVNFKTPKNCSNDDCHALNQSYNEPMIYSHFKDADRNNNPNRALNENITTRAGCEACHINSIITYRGHSDLSTVSHYGSRDELIDSINCIYCHLDRDNAIKWGNATEINKNRTSLKEINKANNKLTAYAGDFIELGLGYRMKVIEISIKRGSAAIELYNGDKLVDSGLINIGRYVYEENRIINNASSRIPVIVLNITEMFHKNNESFIQFEGFKIKRLHYENKTTSCYLCHFNGDAQTRKYTVIDRRNEYVYYTQVLFNSSDKKEYDQEQALMTLANETTQDAHTNIERPKRMTLKEKEKWNLAENYSLALIDVATNSDSAKFLLEADGNTYTDVVKRGEVLEYEPSINYLGYQYNNITIFRANVSEILQGKPNMVVLEDIVALSPEIKKIKDNFTIYGYNVSWLWENTTFLTGRIPGNLHSPLLTEGRDGGADCISCHNVGEMGFHTGINRDASGSVAAANKACWACHGDGNEPKSHPATYKNPRLCKSCHVERKVPFFNATYVGDEKHGTIADCSPCHVVNIHKIIRFNITPGIRTLSISKKEVYAGEIITINASAVAGYEMRVRGAEYYVDSPDVRFPMSARDGSFDETQEGLTAELNTSGLEPGTHSIYVRAMERDNKWGQETTITFDVKEKAFIPERKIGMVFNIFLWFVEIILVLAALILFIKRGRWIKAAPS